MTERLALTCKVCGVVFDRPTQMPRGTFEDPSISISDESYECPQGHMATYEKADMHFRRD